MHPEIRPERKYAEFCLKVEVTSVVLQPTSAKKPEFVQFDVADIVGSSTLCWIGTIPILGFGSGDNGNA